MRLSVLIPMYNAQKYIGNCLDSFINQDIPSEDFEIIVIDDGSTDGSANIVEAYTKKAKNIKLHKQSNTGWTNTRKRLMQMATGDYIYKIDSDDYISYNSLGTLLKLAVENNLDVLGFESRKTIRMDLYRIESEKTFANIDICTGVDFWSKAKNPQLGVNWYLIKRDFITKNGLTFELENNPMADTPFTFQLFLLSKKVAFVPMDVHRYLQVPTSISHSEDPIHLKKMVGYHKALIYKLTDILGEITKKKDSNLSGVIDSIKFWKDVNVYFMIKKLIKINVSIKFINDILKELKNINAYPILNFTEDKSFSKSHKIITYLFNHKYLFFICLYPLRFLFNLKLIKFE
ncbi:hypothetical protein GCM10023311_05100 [Flaviramulus aquimarinus]|uniref:Glycosyltransferase 2-like domain-containing protein n=1 Tax=Flaviramulus aquimarinus TaxID=1170456 RepID=A0ABP9ERQ0_9FLAO